MAVGKKPGPTLSLLFFLSGFSACLYQVLWQRTLTLAMGSTAISTAAILCSLMTGIGAGTLTSSHFFRRLKYPTCLFAFNEFCIALTALIATFIQFEHPNYVSFSSFGGRFLACTLLFSIPCFFIGATFGFLVFYSRELENKSKPRFATLYSINTIGAATGIFLFTCLFLRYFGMKASLYVAVFCNLCASALAFQLRNDFTPTTDNHLPIKNASIAFLLGFILISFEILWGRILSVYFPMGIFLFPSLVFMLLLSSAIGSACYKENEQHFSHLFVVLAVASLLSLFTFPTLPVWMTWSISESTRYTPLLLCGLGVIYAWIKRDRHLFTLFLLYLPAPLLLKALGFIGVWNPNNFSTFFLHLFYLVAPVGYYFGLIFTTLVEKDKTKDIHHFIKRSGYLSGFSSLGGGLAATLTGLWMVPQLGTANGFFVMICLIVLLGSYHFKKTARFVSLTALLLLFITWKFIAPLSEPKKAKSVIDFAEGVTASVTVFDSGDARGVWVDSHYVSNTQEGNLLDQRALAHIPLLLHPAPQRALTVGLGIGGTSLSMLMYPIKVDCVEIEREVTRAAPLISKERGKIFEDPNYRLIIEDARHWLMRSDTKYDVIMSDITELNYKSNADLYSLNYFLLIKENLNPGGIAGTWLPVTGMGKDDFKMLLRSFIQVFPRAVLWQKGSIPNNFVILTGTRDGELLPFSALERNFKNQKAIEDLKPFNLDNPLKLLDMVVTAGKFLETFVGAGPVSTDNLPHLAYSTRNSLRSMEKDFYNNLGELIHNRTGGNQFIDFRK